MLQPKMSRLFAALTINTDSEIDFFSLSSSVLATEAPHVVEYISGSDLRRGNKPDGFDDRSSESQSITGSTSLLPARKQGHHWPNLAEAHTVLHLRNWMAPSPYGEVYPFPPCTKSLIQITEDTSAPALKLRVQTLKTTLTKLSSLLSEGDLRMIEATEELARTYVLLGEWANAEKSWRQVVMMRARFEGSKSLKGILASLQLVKAIDEISGRFEEAERMHNHLQAYVSSNFPGNNDLMLELLNTQALRYANLTQLSKAEKIRRHALQISLSQLGPRHLTTIQNMSKLSVIIGYTQLNATDFNEYHRAAIFLARTAVNLHLDIKSTSESEGRKLVNRLVTTLRISKQFEEGTKIGKMMVERSRKSLGMEHPQTLRYMIELASNYREQGQLQKSLALLRIGVRDVNINQHGLAMIWRREELAKCLEGLGQYQEATDLFTIVYKDASQLFGPLSEDTTMACKNLGNCYLKQGLQTATRELWQHYIVQIKAAEGDAHSLIKEVHGWIQDVTARTSS